MLKLSNIKKQYKTGDLVQNALNDVSLTLRDNEFVAILGPSGSGKTSLLNIIGGLDRYDSGDLIINGISTKKYKDRDWDSYRNHTIGFVFQSYNLIPHQTVLSNVELALTISGISRGERKKRAKQALEEVGLGDQLHKRPNQMSGGQMQRVAIARALVNNPDILLADEPTGALDTETSIQVMELLKKVARNRLVVMVTHNPELAQQYANRIVKLRDGKVTDDSNAYETQEEIKEPEHKNMGKAKMSFLTSLSLSFNNLRTKKGRTILTSFAGSIGIIGIALILALSTGVNTYIADIQKSTMTSYPLTITSQTLNLGEVMGNNNMQGGTQMGHKNVEENRNGVYTSYEMMKMNKTLMAYNNLSNFKKYLDNQNSEIHKYIGENGIVYSYNVSFDAFSYDSNGKLVNTNADTSKLSGSSDSMDINNMYGVNNPMAKAAMGGDSKSAKNFSELMMNSNKDNVSPIVTDNYELVYGTWPKEYNDIIIVLDQNNEIPVETLYQLGLITDKEYKDALKKISNGEEVKSTIFNYSDISDHKFFMVPACDRYKQNDDGTFTYSEDGLMEYNSLLENAVQLNISGIIKPVKDAKSPSILTNVAYTSKLTDYVINHTNESAVVKAQESTPDKNVLNNIDFKAADDSEKIKHATEYAQNLKVSDKASLYTMIMYMSASKEQENAQTSAQPQQGKMPSMGKPMDENTLAAALDRWLTQTPDNDLLLSIYDQYIGDSTYADNMKNFGKVSYDSPSSISIYTDSFEDKESISDCISKYNDSVGKDDKISYTDYVKLMTSSLTTIIDVITYVLIAFVAVSLIVSCIMIGIITHISVLERTKEIGILRALGASKLNISQVFNAETFIIGLFSGILGVAISMLLTVPINAIIAKLVGNATVKAILPVSSALMLILISMIITVLGGLFPASKAAKKDPVIALRTE